MRSDSPPIRLLRAVWRPTPRSMKALALASVAGNAVIMATGAAVRVSGSGLGCPTWPRCTGDSLVPTHDSQHGAVNMAIEFGNRLLTFLLLAIGAAVFIAALRLRPRRTDLVRLAAIQPLSVVAQAIVGGIVVLTDLHPVAVTAHFLLSPALLAAAVVLWIRAGEGDEPARLLVRRELAWLGRALTCAVFVVLVAGTVVTATGPHAGDAKARRFHFRIEQVAQLHADVVWITIGLTFAVLLGLHLTGAPARVRGRAVELLVIELAQGILGYVQYFTKVPAVLVVVHVFGSGLVWIAALRLMLAFRERGPLPRTAPLNEPAEPAESPAPAGSVGPVESRAGTAPEATGATGVPVADAPVAG